MKYYVPKYQRSGKVREAGTFAGRMVQNLGGNENLTNIADITSSVLQLTPYGFIPSALDLGSDLNKYVHNPSKERLGDIGLDVLSMLPFVNKAGLKLGKNTLLNFLQNHRTAVNIPLIVGRFADFENDTPHTKKIKLTDKGILSAQKKSDSN